VDEDGLLATVEACRSLIDDRFPGDDSHGAAAMLLDDGTILTGTAPVAVNPAVQVCHETEPFLAAFRRGRKVVASICLHREQGSVLVLSPCGVCRERLAVHGPDLRVAIPDADDPERIRWSPLSALLPSYWITVFADEDSEGWTT
jgi:cytidine deaminase